MPATDPASEVLHFAPPRNTAPNRTYSHILYAAVLLVCGTFLFLHPGLIAHRAYGAFALEAAHMQAIVRFYVLLFAAAGIAWLLQPLAAAQMERLRFQLTPASRHTITAAALVSCCLGLALFIVHFGRWQYGAWDSNILIEVGWRQLLGQRPYIDFFTPTPPLFNWTAALAFRLFGVNWDANLYLTALFSVGTFLWSFALLRALGMRRVGSLGTALTAQIAAMLTCCFWWYNNTTLILAMLLFLATLLLARFPAVRLGQVTYVILLALLPLSKPNIAGVTIAGCVVLLLIASKRRGQVLLLTFAGALLAALLFLALHISVTGMLATYRAIAKERGGLSTFGFREMARGERRITQLWVAVFCLPLLSLWPALRRDVGRRDGRAAAFWLLFPFSALVAIYGIMGNGELRDVECPLLLCAITLLAFVYEVHVPRLQRLAVTLLFAMAISDLYTGAIRLRVYTMGKGKFFSWTDNQHRFYGGFFNHLRSGADLVVVDQQLQQVVQNHAGPVFLGPRLDFEYAVQGLPSPTHWASFFQPGTAFGRAQTPAILHSWSDHHFATLVFLKGDYTFYPDALLDEIAKDYVRDDRLTTITVYHRRLGS